MLSALIVLTSLANVMVSAIDPVTLKMADKAFELAAPFAQTASERLHGQVFGTGRAARSTDVIVHNLSSKNFKLRGSNCEYGGITNELFPEHEIFARTSSVYGMESNGFLTGVTCEIIYTSGSSWVSLFNDNSYIGRNIVRANSSPDLQVQTIKGQGNNNKVKYIIRDRASG